MKIYLYALLCHIISSDSDYIAIIDREGNLLKEGSMIDLVLRCKAKEYHFREVYGIFLDNKYHGKDYSNYKMIIVIEEWEVEHDY